MMHPCYTDRLRLLICIPVCLLFIPFTAWSQLQDSFDDGDFTLNPTWTGASENFVINANGQLQLNDLSPVLTQSALSVPVGVSDVSGLEWRFKVAQSFAGSDNNHSRIYLSSTGAAPSYTANNTAGVQGYYLKLGEAGSADVIKLYLDNGSTTTLLASGTTLIASAFDLHIKVIRAQNGTWSVYADPTGGDSFTLECSVIESSFTTADFFALVCSYTSSNADNFDFDDFYIGPEVIDTTPPAIASVTATLDNTLQVTFTEAIDENTILSLAQFSITGGLQPTSWEIDANNGAILYLTFSAPFPANTTLTLTIDDVADQQGNIATTLSGDFIWSVAVPANYRDVVFNEVLADPSPVVGLPDAEYVELYNRTSEAINLDGWVLTNTNTNLGLGSYILPANDYVVLCSTSNTALFSVTNVLGIPSFTALTNGGDSLTLKDPNGNIVDILEYSIDWFATSTKADGGWSLEQINPDYPCGNNAGNWGESEAATGGTPGAANSILSTTPDNQAPSIIAVSALNASTIAITFSESIDTVGWSMTNVPMTPINQILTSSWSADAQTLLCITQSPLDEQTEYSFGIDPIADCYGNAMPDAPIALLLGGSASAGDIRFNEIYADPDAASPLPNVEWLELYNTSSLHLRINELVFNGQILSGAPISPGGYIVVTDNASAPAFAAFTGRVIYLESFPTLTNSGMSLELQHTDGTTIDQVTYDLSWYNDPEKEDGGWSLEMINPTLPCSGSNNWNASFAADQGTPGAVNSIFENSPDTQAPTVVSVVPIDGTFFSIQFSEIMNPASWTEGSIEISPFNSVNTAVWNADNTALICTSQSPLNSSITYSLIITGFEDCSGNPLSSAAFEFVLGALPATGDLLITEIMCDPTPSQGLPDAEFVEIYNGSENYLNLYGLIINGGAISTSYLLAPQAYVMVADQDDELAFLFYTTPKLFVEGFGDLTNGGETVQILDATENVFHEVTYSIDWYNDNSKDDGGWSLEMINPNDPCSDGSNWHASTANNGGTPGQVNSVFNDSPDITAPEIQAIYVPTDSEVILDFNEPIDAATLIDATIQVNGGAVQTLQGTLFTSDLSRMSVQVDQMNIGTIYTFQIFGLSDCWGNFSENITGRYAAPQAPEEGDVVINEILYDPYDNGAKFIEILNTSSKTLSLGGWQLNDLSGGEVSSPNVITTLDILLYAGEYLVLTENAEGITNFYSRAKTNRILEIEDLPDYTSADMVLLLFPDSTICDQVAYNSEFHYPLLDETKGVSLERIDPARPSNDETNWHSASSSDDFATPGYLNSQYFELTENNSTLTVDPEIFSPDNDGYHDQAVFGYQMPSEGYTGTLHIYDGEGRLVRRLMTNELLGREGSISWDGINEDRQKATIGMYVVFFEAFNTSGDTQRIKTTCVLAHPLN